ncbi:MAG: hypothetical protein WEE67_06075 [Chloroflexota bacterium]
MTRPVHVESVLAEWLDAEAPSAPPDDLLPAAMTAVARTRQRPAWIPQVDLPTLRMDTRPVWLVALLLLLLAAMAGAVVLGQPRVGPTSVENGLIAFVGVGAGESSWTVDGRGSDIYLVAADGSSLTRLTETTAVEWGPVWSPDGGWLAFVREIRGGGPPPANLDCEADPAACERGTPGEYAVVLSRPEPGSERVVFQSAGVINSLAWSSDGTQISFNHERSGGLMVLDTSTASTRLVLPDSYDIAAWAPDGGPLVASRSVADGSGSDLYLAYTDGTEPIRLTDTEGYEGWPAWSPDGTRIAFSFDPDGSARASRVEVMAADGSARSVLAEEAYGAAWSRDGTLIAFVKTFGDPTGRSNEVWMMAADGTGQRKLADEGSRPRWSPDGELLFWRGNEGTWSIRPDGSSLTKLPTGGVPLIEGLKEADWQAVRR